MGKTFDENSRVKIPALLHLTRLGYAYVSLKDAEGKFDGDTNIYKPSLQMALNRINGTSLSEKETDAIVRDLRNLLDASDLGRQFFDKLQGGVSFDGENLRLIDYEQPENNIFEIVTELPCKNGTDSFRPDITLFVNGLPLAFVEVKIPDNKRGIQAEHDRINWRFAQEKYRRFTNITQIMVFSNNSEYDDSEAVPLTGAFYAASDYTRLFFSRFREEDEAIYQRLAPLDADTEEEILRDTNYVAIKSTPEYETNKSPLSPTNRILTSLFSRERFLFLLRYAFAYVERTNAEGVKTLEKHIMRYPQFFATLAMRRALSGGTKRGVIWHTQGSGKTALAFYNVKYLTDYYQEQNRVARFYFIVDRLDLAQQAADEFRARGLAVVEVGSKSAFVQNLQSTGSMANTGALSINVVNIQKFAEDAVAKTPEYNVSIQRVYFIDEAHRDYKWDGSFLARLMASDRDAVMIALTGTPLIGKFKTRDVFGPYIHRYYYNNSIADGYTLRLIREGIQTKYRLTLEKALAELEAEVEKGALKKKEIYAHENYVRPLVEYIEADFEKSRFLLNDSTIGAMVVCDSSEQAVAVYEEIKAHKKYAVDLVLSTIGDDDEELKAKRTAFKKGETDILVVYQMLLTGFDAPRLKKLYLGRVIKEHNLLQALTRVNRPYKRMRYGYVVDFADIRAAFDKTNQAYLRELQAELGEEFTRYQAIFKTQEEIESDLRFIKDRLFAFNTENAEEFRKEIQAIENKAELLDLRRALTLYKELYNLSALFGYDDLKEKFDLPKIKALYKVVENRVQTVNQKEALANADDTDALLRLALASIEFSFRKISEKELPIADAFMEMRRRTMQEFERNMDKKDPEYIALLEELRRVMGKHDIEEMTAEEMAEQQAALDELRRKMHDKNEADSRLAGRYGGDRKFMRVHKRLAGDFVSPSGLHDLLISVKSMADGKIMTNYALLDNPAFFEHDLWRDLKQGMTDLSMTPDLALIKRMGALIAQEYIEERNN